jgi:hypothetical protein
MQEKTISLAKTSTTTTTLLPIGADLQLDLGFYKVASIRGFKWDHLGA